MITHSWAELVATAPVGTKVSVTRMDRSRVEGKVVAIDAASIGVEQNGSRLVVAATDVLEVRRAGVRRQRVLRYGIPLGMLVGGLATMAIDSRSGHPEPGTAFGVGAVIIGLPLGAVTAAVLPLGPPLYKASADSGTKRP